MHDAVDRRWSSRTRRAAESARCRSRRLAVGNPISRPRRPSLDDRAVQEIGVSEQRAGFVHAAFGRPAAGCACCSRRNPCSVPDRSCQPGSHSAGRASAARVKFPLRPWPNRKFAPTHTSETRNQSTSTVLTNVSGSHSDSSRVNRTTATQLMPAPMERLEPLRFGHEQLRRLVRPQDARRMRIEGHRHRRAAVLGSATPDALDDLEMAAMQAVEIAERQNRMHQPRRPRVVREVDGLHSLHVDSHVEHEPIICQFDALQAGARSSRHARDRASCASCTRAAASSGR